ncbi:hypothetical protein HanXRQr2_Chr02g0055431 [Helianthus annuus]|uniref:Uncharacterized protein n=1 Tax=Helianthus annuus TaxID=4232 RepID=A0A251VED2_HELAN|nr:hypothetical protein HanXRQr2_Chr02g0055431 [Helianthus annuus]KAJ0950981.1 hypothetical protein HanPSC8_Chr02g0054661 [Helianthus annuus]
MSSRSIWVWARTRVAHVVTMELVSGSGKRWKFYDALGIKMSSMVRGLVSVSYSWTRHVFQTLVLVNIF